MKHAHLVISTYYSLSCCSGPRTQRGAGGYVECKAEDNHAVRKLKKPYTGWSNFVEVMIVALLMCQPSVHMSHLTHTTDILTLYSTFHPLRIIQHYPAVVDYQPSVGGKTRIYPSFGLGKALSVPYREPYETSSLFKLSP